MNARASVPTSLYPMLAAVVLSGCSAPSDVRGDDTFAPTARTFSAQDKRIATVLSLGAGADLEQEGSPYTEALACKVAYDDVLERLSQPGLVSGEQRRAMEAAGTLFKKRLVSFAAAAGKSSTEIENDARFRVAEVSNTEVNARVLISCLRKLQEDAQR